MVNVQQDCYLNSLLHSWFVAADYVNSSTKVVLQMFRIMFAVAAQGIASLQTQKKTREEQESGKTGTSIGVGTNADSQPHPG